jgi:hypothetical protein
MASLAGKLLFSILVIFAALVASFVVNRLCHLIWTWHQEDESKPRESQNDHEEERELEDLFLLEKDEDPLSPPTGTSALPTVSRLLPTVPLGTFQALSDQRPSLEEFDIVALSNKLFSQKKLAAWAMVGCALSLALAQMMVCAAVADSMLVAAVGQSCAVAPPRVFTCTSHLSIKPFQSDDLPASVLSIGLVLAATITVSLAAVDLDAMVTSQYVLFVCLFVSCIRFSYTLHGMGQVSVDPVNTTTAPKYIGGHPFDSVGPILFNFAFIVTAPPLICGTTSAERASWSLVGACCLMGVLYTIVGSAGANAAANRQSSDNNLLSLVFHGRDAATLNFWDVLAVALFGLSQLASIPVYCELARATLHSHLQFSNRYAVFLASNVGPWLIVACAYNSALFEAFVEWSSLLLLGFANFSIPLLLDLVYSRRLQTMERVKLHPRVGDFCPGGVTWGLALITASIAAVIVQRVMGILLLTEIMFLVTVGIIASRYTKHNHILVPSSTTLAD